MTDQCEATLKEIDDALPVSIGQGSIDIIMGYVSDPWESVHQELRWTFFLMSIENSDDEEDSVLIEDDVELAVFQNKALYLMNYVE
jgi:hypothetical protein